MREDEREGARRTVSENSLAREEVREMDCSGAWGDFRVVGVMEGGGDAISEHNSSSMGTFYR